MAVGRLTRETQDLHGLVASVISTWRSGARPKACDALTKHPELRDHKSAVLDLAHEEYHLRRTQGEAVSPSAFCEQFPGYQKSVRRILNVHRELVDDSPEALDALAREFEADLELEKLRQAPIDWPQIGEQIMGFEIHEELGKGAFARVYLASEIALGGRLVALKLSRQGSAEAKTLGKLSHPNIVPIHSVQIDAKTHVSAVCMPFLGRATLYDVLDLAFAESRKPNKAIIVLSAAKRGSRGRAVPEAWHTDRILSSRMNYSDAIVHLGAQLADALAYTHSKGILHRDIKPSNILLTPQGVPMLLDFNLSLDADAVSSLVGGTVPYMAPELLQAVVAENPASVAADSRADVFSLGAILYELLVGVVPFGDPEFDILADKSEQLRRAVTYVRERQSKGPPVRVPANKHLNDTLFNILARCLSFDPADRPQSAGELADQLREYCSLKNRVRRWANHRRVALGVTSVIAASLLAATAIFAFTRPSFAVREYELGVQSLQAKDYPAAIEHFDHSIQADSHDPRFLFARAQGHLQREDYSAVMEDLHRVAKMIPAGHDLEGLVHAERGFAMAKSGDITSALAALTKAVEAGNSTPDVRNNLGFCYLQLSILGQAQRELDLALQAEPKLQAALLNRMITQVNLVGKTNAATPEMKLLMQKAIDDIETAIASTSPHPELHYYAAMACALADQKFPDPGIGAKAEKHILESLKLGLEARRFQPDGPLFGKYFKKPLLQQLLRQPAPLPNAPPLDRLIPPAANLQVLNLR